MSMFNDIDWTKKGNSDVGISNTRDVGDHQRVSARAYWSTLGPGDEEKWYGTCNYQPEGQWDQQANQMLEVFAQTGHPVFRGTSALSRGTLKRKQAQNTIHFTADSENIELIMRTIHSTNQLSIYGTMSSWCVDLSGRMQRQESTGVNVSIKKEVGSLAPEKVRNDGLQKNNFAP